MHELELLNRKYTKQNKKKEKNKKRKITEIKLVVNNGVSTRKKLKN